MAISAIPIIPVETTSGNQFRLFRIIEKATQTFLSGTPVSVDSGTGAIQVWDGTTISTAQGAIAGICSEAASNLASTGLGAPTPFSPFLGTGSAVTFGSVPNESSAVNIPHGAPFNDGRIGVYSPTSDTVYSATFGTNGNTTTPAVTDVGKIYGMTIDSNSKFWYVDKNKVAGNAVVQVVGLDPRDVPAAGTRVLFRFLSTTVNLLG